MSEIQKISVAVTSEQAGQLKDAVNAGEYATASEIVREALRDWTHKRNLRQEELRHLRQAWETGKASGPAEAIDLNDLRAEGKRRLAARAR